MRYEQIFVEIVLFERGVGHFERKFQGEGGRPPMNFGVRKLESLAAKRRTTQTTPGSLGYHIVLFA